MDDSNGGKEDNHKVGIKLGKQPKVEEQNNVDEKPVDEPPKVDVVTLEVDVVAPKVDFRIEFTTEWRFEQHVNMLSWVRDLAEK
jgi:hypothetical protein